MDPNASRASVASWRRIPAQSTRPITGAPVFIARSYRAVIFLACISPTVPFNTEASWLYTYTRFPSITPYPVITPSEGAFVSVKLKSVDLAVTLFPISTKLFASSKEVILVPAKLCVALLILVCPPSLWEYLKVNPKI